ncbi:dihydrofolate reductase [Parapedobacter composti]|uniref:Dihydrofolate reductase n=1 Tax=Parapedobacter composti TaxID=623281 RepID=A0A1I1JL85_9SPHI|nr:dihydrofolate reductase [Parapedobacter composti]SFC49369.1 dihydrofolate reductase [Parapedobacter composti]
MERPSCTSIIVAAAENNAIGKDNRLLWHLPNDLKFFKQTTTGHSVIMGRKTYESMGRPLPNRRNIIITRQPDYHVEGGEVVHSLDAAFELCAGEDEAFVIGGGEIYRQALPLVNRIYLTRVHTRVDGDSYFPEFSGNGWTLVGAAYHVADARHAYGYTFEVYERKQQP